MPHGFARWNHGVGYVGNSFPVYGGIPNVGGLTSSQFPPADILPSHYNNIPLYPGTNSVCYTNFLKLIDCVYFVVFLFSSNCFIYVREFMSVLKDMESLAKHQNRYQN